jgi:hypothetical protein
MPTQVGIHAFGDPIDRKAWMPIFIGMTSVWCHRRSPGQARG